MPDKWTDDFFMPSCEQATLYGNDVGHLAEEAVTLPDCKIGERVASRRAAKRQHGDWFTTTFGGKDGE